MINLYQVLGVHFTASQAAIKSAYRERSRCWHPDRPGGNEVQFQSLAAAYQILSHETRRSQWDALRAQWLAERNAINCSGCWTPNRIRINGVAMKCGRCHKQLKETGFAGQITIATAQFLYSAADVVEGVVSALVDWDALRGIDLNGEFKKQLEKAT